MSKNEIVVVSKEELKELIKEAVAESLAGAPVSTKEVKEEKATKKSESKKEAKEVAEEEVEESNSALSELEALTYNDLKKKCKELGVSAVGKRDDLLARLAEALQGSESEKEDEETNESTESEKPATGAKNHSEKASKEEDDEEDEESDSEEDILALLNGLKKPEIIAIAEEMGEEIPAKYNKKKFIDYLMTLEDSLLSALEVLGYIDAEDVDDEEDEDIEESDDEEITLADELDDLTLEELADICKENGLSAKGKKQALIDRLVKAVEDGDIEESDIFEDEADEDEEDEAIDADYEDVDDEEDEEDWYSREELDDMSDEELEEIAEEEELEIPKKKVKKGKKKVSVLDREALIEAILELGEEELDEESEDLDEEEDDDFEPTEERLKAEEEIEKSIRSQYSSKKLKDAKIKNFLAKYNEGNPDFDPKAFDKEEALEEYIKIHKALVDDDGEAFDLESVYIRNNQDYCCGKALEEDGDTLYCEVCGSEYEL